MKKLYILTLIFLPVITNAQRRENFSNAYLGAMIHENGVGVSLANSFGIGRYAGIETLEVDGRHKDYLLIQYAGNDKLYVPVEQIEQVQKYIGSEEKKPKVYSLGGSEWSKVKNRVRSSVQDIAAVMSLEIADGVVQTIRGITNPDKLAHLGTVADLRAILRRGRTTE